MLHTLKIISLHDAQAECSCCKWYCCFTGSRTREQITEEWEKHIAQYEDTEAERPPQ